MKKPVVVVGAGAAGIFAAWRAAQLGSEVVLLEKTERLGTKILISGGGKCNITHAGSVTDVLKAFRTNEAHFLRPSFYKFFNDDVQNILTERGLEVYTRPNGRVFPVHQTAKDVVKIFYDLLREADVDMKFSTPVLELRTEIGSVTGVTTISGEIAASHVVVCVGGSSYPKSGTTGDGWAWARALGHKIVPVRAALAPIELDLPKGDAWAGTALRDVELRARSQGKALARWRDDLLFTHWGISGPTALGISREVEEAAVRHQVMLEIDTLPDEPFEKLQHYFRGYKSAYPNRKASSLIEGMVPSKLLPEIADTCGLDLQAPLQSVTQKQINLLTETLKSWKIGTVKQVPIDKGEVVAGGVALTEVDPKSMKSSKSERITFCGEILDIAGPVGGYNLQAAFSTGYVAGETAAADFASQ